MRYRYVVALIALLGVMGCVPLMLDSKQPYFEVADYVFPLNEGTYDIDDGSEHRSVAEVFRNGKGITIRTAEPGEKPNLILGGFVALKEPNYFIFQLEDIFEENSQSEKPPGETAYVPAIVDATGVTFYTGPKDCDAECDALFSRHGFTRGSYQQWRAPTEHSKERLIAFYRNLVTLLPGPQGKWDTMRLDRIK